jgi:phage/plasmid-like protein (TIGR03299 family)
MSHEIVNNEMAWKNNAPWHGLGVEVAPDATGEEMLQAASMLWTVEKRPFKLLDASGNAIGEPIKGYAAITRSDNGEVFQVSTDRYNIVQPREIVDVFKQYCDAGHATIETLGALRGGAVVWALAKLNTKDEVIGVSGDGQYDTVKSYVLMATSNDGSIRTVGKATQVCVVCANTLRAALNGGVTFAMKHSKAWTQATATQAREALGVAVEECQAVNALSQSLSRVSIDQRGRIEFLTRVMGGENILDMAVNNTETIQDSGASLLDAMIANHVEPIQVEEKLTRVGKAVLEAMMTSPGNELASRKDTLWGAVNGITYYADHQRGRTQDNRLANTWFGTSETLKNTAMIVAAQMAGIESPLLAK